MNDGVLFCSETKERRFGQDDTDYYGGPSLPPELCTTSFQLRSVAPSGKLAWKRCSHSNQTCAVRQGREANILMVSAQTCVTESTFGLFYSLPSLLYRCEIPPPTPTARCPEPTLPSVEREALPYGKSLNGLVRPKILRTEDAVPIHGIVGKRLTEAFSGTGPGGTQKNGTMMPAPVSPAAAVML